MLRENLVSIWTTRPIATASCAGKEPRGTPETGIPEPGMIFREKWRDRHLCISTLDSLSTHEISQKFLTVQANVFGSRELDQATAKTITHLFPEPIS